MSEIDYETYAKAMRPAAESVELTVEAEAQGIARRFRQIPQSNLGERQHNLGQIEAEAKILERNQANGYGGWDFRVAVLRRAVELIRRGY